MTMKTFRAKRLRRTAKQVIKFGPKAKATHKARSGRTGGVLSHQLKGR